MNEVPSKSRLVTGMVISNLMDKSITVSVIRQVRHAKYGKYIKQTTKLHAHDEKNECRIGDKVMIKECRPISKTKAFVLVNIVEKTTSD